MCPKKIDVKVLDTVVDRMVKTVHSSKNEVFHIGEHSRQEFEQLKKESLETRQKLNDIIDEGDRLEAHTKLARMRLSEVSKNFKRFSESEVREAYERAHNLQMNLTMNRQKEQQLRERRDDLDRRIMNLRKTVERAEALGSQITVVLNYLTGSFQQVGEMIADAKQKQDFGLKIIEAQEDERRRLSREIHDGPAQMLANVMMRSELIDRIAKERNTEEALKEVRDLRQMVRSALYEVRRIIYDLRPMALDDLGLIPTLKRYLATIEEYNKLTIHFRNLGEERRISSRLEVALFRLVQEATQNAVKHAEATEINVKIEISHQQSMVVVKDNGKGFDPEERNDKSFGLLGMRERVDLLEGEMTIHSALGKGTNITIMVPTNEASEE
ncbi:sensor histidine kinase [Aureibacillus halotolerans]|uniref:Signal transduction histidine-protein kinase/phosphatase DegS n=1 Tax=Aureibacillus halotolerans TaxID=1508390 RepID=A0A4R6TU87_9BACI|nr:sensor histidine kinase [Aureibacillus halotolerans]TDQ36921.1 two-component system sensor histidine kinase DegS [Aureibacillus halotolerans]